MAQIENAATPPIEGASSAADRQTLRDGQNDKIMEKFCGIFPQFILPNQSFSNCPFALYQLEEVIGSGATSVVFVGKCLQPSEPELYHVAVKFIDLDGRDESDRNRAIAEAQCLVNCNFFTIIRCHRDFVSYGENAPGEGKEVALALVLEFVNAGDLRLQIKKRKKAKTPFLEHEAALLFVQILLGLYHLHSKHMLHRDIKSANILLQMNGFAKIGDFGFSKMYQTTVSDAVGKTFCGTPYYVAPEIWQKSKYSSKADMYSLGVLYFEMLTLERPFDGSDAEDIRASVLEDDEPTLPDTISKDTRDLVSSLMSREPRERPSAAQVLTMPSIKFFTSSLLEIVHSGASGVAEEERSRIIHDVEVVRREIANGVPVVVPVRPAPMTEHLLPLAPELSSTASAPAQAGSTIQEGQILMESVVWRANVEAVWKRRYLCLFTNSEEAELLLSADKGSIEVRCIRKKLSDFDDVFEVSPQYTVPPKDFAFALMTGNGNKLIFSVRTREDLDFWISHLRYQIHQIALRG